jgi:glycosyltransferase involved in cell wall biosynthesis
MHHPSQGKAAALAHGAPTILQIIPRLELGGAEVTTVEVTEAIVKSGGRALVLSEGGRLQARIANAGGEFIKFPAASKNPARILWNSLVLKRVAVREGVDLIHARSRAPAWSALLAARSLGLPFVTTYHGAYRETGWLKNLYNGVMARADVVIANSEYTASSIRTRYGKPDPGIAVIYRGVDFERFVPDHATLARAAALRHAWGIAPSQRIVLHAARLTPLKGQPTVIEAARLLAQTARLDGVAFVLAGSGEGRNSYATSLAEQINQAGLQEHVRLVGHLDDMPAAFAAAHLALMVSIEPEGFGRVSAEAQAMGCPVIVSEIGALPETVLTMPQTCRNSITGWLVKPGDAVGLADCVARALAISEGERSEMGRRARARVLARFSASQMQRSTLAVYDRLLGAALAKNFEARATA